MKGINSILAAIGVMLLVFIIITTGTLSRDSVITEQVVESQLDARPVASTQLNNNQVAINPAATNPLAIQRVPNDQVSTDDTAAEQPGSKCAPGWVETGDGIICVPGLFKMLDVADTGGPGEKNCWDGGMVLNCRD